MAIELEISERFEKALVNLTDAQRSSAQKAIENFIENSRRASLNFEKVKGTDYCTIRMNRGDRIVLKKIGSQCYLLIDVGNHDYIYRSYG